MYIEVDKQLNCRKCKIDHVVNDDLLLSGAIFNFYFLLEYFCHINSHWWHHCGSMKEFNYLSGYAGL
jgi:hypothetical protein